MSGEVEGGSIGDLLAANTSSAPPPGTGGPGPLRDLSSILQGASGHFQIDLEQAPRAIADFRHAAQAMRDLKDEVDLLVNVNAPGLDAVSLNAVAEIKRWANGAEPGSLRSALEQGAMRLDDAAGALEQSLKNYRQTDEVRPVESTPLEM